MNRGSDTFVWGVRWETVERRGDTPLYGAALPDIYPSLSAAQEAQQRLDREQPLRPDPETGGEPRRVRYEVYARQPDAPDG
jgi:hypothetical protein